MKAVRFVPVVLFAVAMVAACRGPSKKEVEMVSALRSDSVAYLRDQLFEHAMQATQFVNEINKELSKARSMGNSGKLQTTAELADVNEERVQVLARVGQLVERLDLMQGRLAGLRKQVADKDSTLAWQVASYEQLIAETNQTAERQRAELQAVVDSQTTRIASLTKQVDTLSGVVTQLTSDHNTVYFVAGTRAELVKKGVLVPKGKKRFLVAGPRAVVPARDLDPSLFTRIDRTTDSTIFLPDGVYKIVSQQNPAYVSPELSKGGKIGELKIEQPDRFWNTSRYLILVRT